MSNRYAPWGEVHRDFKDVDENGTRWVMDYVDGAGVCLVRWVGPTEDGA